jgi:hypothetical protein
MALAQTLDELQILDAAATAGVGYGYAAPLGEFGYQLVVDAAL